jgi:glycosyltransferase involved in cell wall biosynthesis
MMHSSIIIVFVPLLLTLTVVFEQLLLSFVGRKNDERSVISVIMPCYNCHVAWLEQTLQSLRQQSLCRHLEIILVDDGSLHHRQLPVMGDADKFARMLTVRHGQNRGLVHARNTGASIASSPFLVFLDPDDLIEPLALEKLLLAHLLANDDASSSLGAKVGFVYPGVTHFRSDAQHPNTRYPFYYQAVPYSEGRLLDLSAGGFIPSFALIARDLYWRAGGMCPAVQGFEDYDFWIRLMNVGAYGGRLVDEPLFWYRRHDRGRTAQLERQQFDWVEELRRTNLHGLGPCYPRRFQDPLPIDIDRIISRLEIGDAVRNAYLFIPWMERGGAEQYELDLLTHCRIPGIDRWVVVTDTPSTHPWRHRYQQATPLLFHADTLTTSPGQMDRFVALLFRLRPPALVVVRNSRLGYSVSSTYPHVAFVDIQHLRGRYWEDLSANAKLSARIVVSPDLLPHVRHAVHILPMIDAKIWHPSSVRNKYATEDKVPRVAFVGRADEQKDPKRWSRITRLLHQSHGVGRLVVARGPLVHTLKGDSMHDWIENAATLRELMTAHPTVLLMTSRVEGLPLIAVQCLMAGVPVVAPRINGLHSLAQSPLLHLYAPEASDSYVADLVWHALATYKMHTDAMDAFPSSRLAELFSPDRFCSQWHQVMASCLQDDAKSRPTI